MLSCVITFNFISDGLDTGKPLCETGLLSGGKF
jgi:hypothetical protein